MERLIELANKDLNGCSDYCKMMNYFRHNSSLSQALSNACSYELNNNPNNLNESLLGSMLSKNITLNDIELFDLIVDDIQNEYIKARIYHLLFLNRAKRCRSDVINSMSSYYKSVEILENNDIYTTLNVLSMIIYLGNTVGFYEEVYKNARSKLIELLEELKQKNPSLAIQALMLVDRFDIQSKEYIVNTSKFLSGILINQNNEGQAILALGIAKNNISQNSRSELDEVNRKISDCFISIAHSHEGLAAAHYLLKAINTLAEIKNTRKERLALYEEMRDYQIESMLELKYCETEPYDISTLLKESSDILNKSQDLFDMLFRIACCICGIAEINELKKSEIQQEKNFIDLFYPQQMYIDHQGMNMTIEKIPSILDFEDIPEEDKQSLWSKIVMRMKIHHQISANVIQESLRILNTTYSVKYENILNLCTNNPFIPSNHEEFFAKGIFSGLRGDFLTACHLLVPQIENSLRHLLEIRAEEPTTLHSNNEQERDGLKSLLENPEIIRIFGIDEIIHLRTVLIDKRYPGLRHFVAHGFINSNYFYGTAAIYTWWLIFRIIMASYKDFWEKNYLKNETALDN